MPRKRASKGRARQVTPKSKLLLEIERANRKLRSLEKGGEYGKFASKKLLRLVANSENFSYKRGRRNKIQLRSSVKLETPNLRIYFKKFGEFLKSATSSVFGIRRARSQAEKKLKRTLGGLLDRKVSNEDIDEFYELMEDSDFKYIADKIGGSESYVLVENIKEKNMSYNDFEKQFGQFFDTNNFDFKIKAKKLYDKFIKMKYGEIDYNAVFVGQWAGGIENLNKTVEKAKKENLTVDEFYYELLKFKSKSIRDYLKGAPEGRYTDSEVGNTYHKVRDFYNKYIKDTWHLND